MHRHQEEGPGLRFEEVQGVEGVPCEGLPTWDMPLNTSRCYPLAMFFKPLMPPPPCLFESKPHHWGAPRTHRQVPVVLQRRDGAGIVLPPICSKAQHGVRKPR